MFDQLKNFGLTPRTIKLALPEHVTGSGPGSDQPPFNIRAGAPTVEVTIRPLTMAERSASDLIMDAVQPPPLFREEPGDRPGMPPRRVQDGFDHDDPDYIAKIRVLNDKHDAHVVLHGMVGLLESTPGADVDAKIASILQSMASKLIRFVAEEIRNASWVPGSPDEFFTIEGSSSTPSSETSQNQNPKGTKKK